MNCFSLLKIHKRFSDFYAIQYFWVKFMPFLQFLLKPCYFLCQSLIFFQQKWQGLGKFVTRQPQKLQVH